MPNYNKQAVPLKPASLTFVNQTEAVALVYPISTSGRRGKAKKVLPAGELKIKVKVGGVFVVESSDGKIHQIHSPSVPGHRVVLE